MTALSTVHHLIVALIDGGLDEKEAEAVADACWTVVLDNTRSALLEHQREAQRKVDAIERALYGAAAPR